LAAPNYRYASSNIPEHQGNVIGVAQHKIFRPQTFQLGAILDFTVADLISELVNKSNLALVDMGFCQVSIMWGSQLLFEIELLALVI
jgi:hypothetical protein